MNNQSSFDAENQFELSYELLYLLRWLVDRESAVLKKLIARAVQNGLRNQLHDSSIAPLNTDIIHNSIIDFFYMLDSLLQDTINEGAMKKALATNLIPALHKIDSNVCDKITLQSSLDKATAHLEQHPHANAKELLYKEILRHWKPHKKKTHS